MKKVFLICPEERPNVASLGEAQPLVLAPLLGKPLLFYWLERLASEGAEEVRILAVDRPEEVRNAVGDGARWGLKIEVAPELRELSIKEVRGKYLLDPLADRNLQTAVYLVDTHPSVPGLSPFSSYQAWFETCRHVLQRQQPGEMLGMKERWPGVWVHTRAQIAAGVTLNAPVWIGENVYVSPQATVGPNAILEQETVVESGAEISESLVGPQTYVGELTHLHQSIAFGGILINWLTNSCTNVPDAFLLSTLKDRPRSTRCSSMTGRLAAFLLMTFTLPWALLAIARAKLKDERSLRSCLAVRPQKSNRSGPPQTFEFYELANVTGWGRRWPQLWNIIAGDFVWVGNRPLTPDKAAQLTTDFERLWLEAPIGLISQADAEGCRETFNDEARAHSSFYTVQANWRLDFSILRRAMRSNTSFF